LVGTADVQYQEWRDLLRQIFESESGIAAEDVTVYAEPEPAVPVEDALPTLPTPAVVDQAAGSGATDGAPTDAGGPEAAPAEASTPPAQDAAPAASEAPAATVTDAAASPKPGA
jgi:hypothetical protein